MERREVVWIDCPHCKGTGDVELSSIYKATLKLLSKMGPTTAAKLSKIAKCNATNMNNRLAYLERHGLASSFRDGVRRFYTVTQ